MDFHYLGQTPVSDEHINKKMNEALALFHQHKDAFIDLGAHQGKGGRVIENWHIPKLELMQSVVPNIWANGVAMQWNADHTEHAHITEIKNTGRGNNQNYELQIARNLGCSAECHCFDLATSLEDVGFLFGQDFGTNIDTTADLLEEINPVFDLEGNRQKPQHYFALASQLQNSLFPKVP